MKIATKKKPQVKTAKELYEEAQGESPRASRRWGLACLAGDGLKLFGWYRTEKAAKQVAIHLYIAEPVLARWATAREIKNSRNV
jgi:hypothetical protein